MQRWTATEPIDLPGGGVPFVEASLELEDLRHDGPSFAVYLYFDNPDVDEEAGEDGDGYIGNFFVFGHGECWGGAGHCDVPSEPVNAFDTRPLHPLTPVNFSIDCTAALRKLGDQATATITALAFSVDPEEKPEPLKFARLSLITYD